MKQYEVQEILTYRWWQDTDEEISEDVLQMLDESAYKRIYELREDGYTSGELHTEIYGEYYYGFWEITAKNNSNQKGETKC